MNGWQRVALVAGVVILLFAVQQAVSPFRPAYQRAGCGSPLSEAFTPDIPPDTTVDSVRRAFGITPTTGLFQPTAIAPPCRTPSRQRLERAGVFAGIAVIGTMCALLILHTRRPGPET